MGCLLPLNSCFAFDQKAMFEVSFLPESIRVTKSTNLYQCALKVNVFYSPVEYQKPCIYFRHYQRQKAKSNTHASGRIEF